MEIKKLNEEDGAPADSNSGNTTSGMDIHDTSLFGSFSRKKLISNLKSLNTKSRERHDK